MLIGYARVSTDDQNLELQKQALQAAGCEEMFTDVASGTKADRPGLMGALRHARKGDVLVVWRLDRLGRSIRDLIEQVQGLETRGIEFRSLQEGMDTTTPTGRLLFHIAGAFAQFERDLIRERTQAGLAAARARGRKGGRKAALTPKDVEMARKLLADPQIRVDEVAARFKVSRSTLYRSVSKADRLTAEASAIKVKRVSSLV